MSSSWPPKKEPKKRTPEARPAASAKREAGRETRALKALSDRLPKITASRKKLRSFADLGWVCADATDDPLAGTDVVAVDLGVEGICVTTFTESFTSAKDDGRPTMVLVEDPHAFRTLEPFSLDVGLPAMERWPAERVLRGTHGSIMLPSQIGLVEFPGDHVLAGLVNKIRSEHKKTPKQLVLTLPTFLPSGRSKAIRKVAAPSHKSSFAGVPGAIASAYFYLAPGVSRIEDFGMKLVQWSKEALAAGRVLVLDWGASGLGYGFVTIQESKKQGGKTGLRLRAAGTWPSLGGHRLTLSIALRLKQLIVARILEEGPSDDLVPLPLFKPGTGEIPRPWRYKDAVETLVRIGEPRNREEESEQRLLSNRVFPTIWRFDAGDEPRGYAPYRRLAIQHFKELWKGAERIKRLILSDPERYRKRKTVPFNLGQMDSPFLSHLSGGVDFPVDEFLAPVEANLDVCLRHIESRLSRRNVKPTLHVGLAGMQAASPLLRDAVERLAIRRDSKSFRDAKTCPPSSDPRELKSVVNRGAALLNRERRQIDFGPVPDVLPFSVQIADALENITIFAAGPLDELVVFQRRVRVEEGFPQFEFLLYSSVDGTQQGSWGAINFHRPFEFSERDRAIAVDPRYGFRKGLPKLRDMKADEGKGLTKCFDRTTRGWTDGRISFRAYAPRKSDEARRLLHFLEHGLFGEFYRKVFLLEREFSKPPKRFDYIYQRYYLSRSQELLVVREWWAPTEDGKLMRNKTLHICQGSTEANTILGLDWGTY
jgi:hypothetical protein